MATIPINDPADDRVREFTQIREKDVVSNSQTFIAEGRVVLEVLADSHALGTYTAEKILVLENRLAGLESLLARFGGEVPVYVVSRPVIDAIAGFPMHRGILALGRRRDMPEFDRFVSNLPKCALVVVAIGLTNHDNMGALLRNAAVLGADALIIDETCCDPLYRKSIRVSVGHALSVPTYRMGGQDGVFAALGKTGFSCFALSPSGQVRLSELQAAGHTALVVGTEGAGLPENLLADLLTVRIPQTPGTDSLNVATSAAIALCDVAQKLGKI